MFKINKFISNKKIRPLYKNYTAIIGLNPSKGARSPALWNAAFKGYKIKNQMIPLDVNSKKLFKLLTALEKDPNFIGGCVTIPHKERVFHPKPPKTAWKKVLKREWILNKRFKKLLTAFTIRSHKPLIRL